MHEPSMIRACLAFAALAVLLLSGCASMQRGCASHPWLLCGDRITFHRPQVYLDDPAYLYNNRAPARAGDGAYAFRLSLFFNPHRFRTPRLTAVLRTPDAAAAPVPCRIADGHRAASVPDTAWQVVATPRKERVNLRFVCPGYQPRWGRADTLDLRFSPGPGSQDSAATLVLPFTPSFHGPVYSFVIGSLMLVTLTAVGEVLASDK